MSATVETTVITAAPVAPPSRVSIQLDQVKVFSFAELLSFQAALAIHIKGEFKKVAKAAKVKRVKDPSAPKKALSVGMLAWKAYVKDLKVKQAELFAGLTFIS